jgi:hypothetical protein
MNAERILSCQGRTLARRLPVARHEFRRLVLGPAVTGSSQSLVPRRRQLSENGCEFQPPVTHEPQRPEPGATLRPEQLRVDRQPTGKADLMSRPHRLPLAIDDCSTTPPLRLPGNDGCKTATRGKPPGRSRCDSVWYHSVSRRWSDLKQPSTQSSKTGGRSRTEFLRLSIPWCTRVTCVPQGPDHRQLSRGISRVGKGTDPGRPRRVAQRARWREALEGMLIAYREVTPGVPLHRAYRCHRRRTGGAWSDLF